MKRIAVVTLAIAVVLAAVAVVRRGPSGVAVDVEPVALREVLRATVTASGEIVPTRYADVGSSVMGWWSGRCLQQCRRAWSTG